ncbi:MAG: hypothetical protein EAZ97_15725 [Bacteroidetes bacterium]|nr:MAG: hypothetical protein EAZ97_15725 [Bacteroidota bacterium]
MLNHFPNNAIKVIFPKSFEAQNHWYPKALNATIHPMVNFFLSLDMSRVVTRYCHLHPVVTPELLSELLHYVPKHLHWSGADLINVSSADAKKRMVVIEVNSCPSGQKSMPLQDDNQELGGYKTLIERTFKPLTENKRLIKGVLAVIYDKNLMEASGYAAAMAEVFKEKVYLVPYMQKEDDFVRVQDSTMQLINEEGDWENVRACFRYLTQKPWDRLPVHSKTFIFNPIIACLAGGRNKMIAAKAYDFMNAELERTGLQINTPQTIWDVSKNEIPLWVNKLGGHAVIKVPYSNAGQGVYTIVNKTELDAFMATDFNYQQFIVQSLIGNYNWSSNTSKGKLYHVGTVPDKNGKSYVADLRMMIHATENGFQPLAIYARKAAQPLVSKLDNDMDSWSILGTNLSTKKPDGTWETDTNRLILMDRRDFNKIGLGLDDLIEAYIQTVLASISIDKMAENLTSSKGRFKMKLFRSLNNDPSLIKEILLD